MLGNTSPELTEITIKSESLGMVQKSIVFIRLQEEVMATRSESYWTLRPAHSCPDPVPGPTLLSSWQPLPPGRLVQAKRRLKQQCPAAMAGRRQCAIPHSHCGASEEEESNSSHRAPYWEGRRRHGQEEFL